MSQSSNIQSPRTGGASSAANPTRPGEFYSMTFALDNTLSFANQDRDPDIRINCDTVIVIQNDATDMQIALNRQMMNGATAIPVSQSPQDNLLKIRGNILEGLWLSFTGVSGGKLKILYGKGIEVAQSNKTINVLTIGQNLLRYGRNFQPTWQQAAEVTGAGATATLATKTVVNTTGVSGWIYGVFIDTADAQEFALQWTSGGNAKQKRFSFAGKGFIMFTNQEAVNEGFGADKNTAISIVSLSNLTNASKYQADFLEGEI